MASLYICLQFSKTVVVERGGGISLLSSQYGGLVEDRRAFAWDGINNSTLHSVLSEQNTHFLT